MIFDKVMEVLAVAAMVSIIVLVNATSYAIFTEAL